MSALKFISEIVSHRSIVLLTNARGQISSATADFLRTRSDLQVIEIADANINELPNVSANVVIHFAGFDKPSLAQTLHHTSTLHRLMDYCLRHHAKFILVLPQHETPEQQTSITLLSQFGKNFALHFTIITIPHDLGASPAAMGIVRSFIHNFKPPAPRIVPPTIIPIPPTKKSDAFSIKMIASLLLLLAIPWVVFLSGLGIGAMTVGCGFQNLKQADWNTAKNCGWMAAGTARFLQAERLWVVGSGFLTKDFFISARLLGQNIVSLGQAGEAATSGNFKDLAGILPGLSDQLAYSQADLQKLPYQQTWTQAITEARTLVTKSNLLLPGLVEIVAAPKQVWLVLLQEADELRPTGGFIAKFALVTLEKGVITDVQLYDTEATDSLLRGQVDPPADLAKVTHQANWYLRDSNWNPNFSDSAARAAWFVNKELGQNVDGVVGVNSLLRHNLSQILASEDSWSEVLTEFKTGTSQQQGQIWSLVIQGLQSRQISLYFPQEEEALALVGWDGGVPCCTPDTVYVVDSNVGVNKVNSQVKPSYHLAVTPQGSVLNYKFDLTYLNTSTSAAWPLGNYANYVRLMVPEHFVLDQIEQDGQPVAPANILLSSQAGMVVWGVLVNVPPGETKTVTILAHQQLAGPTDHYQLRWLNQPGQTAIPLTIASSGEVGYNTVLSKPVEINVY